MKITVICVGKVKERYWNMAIEEYAKRLSAFCKLEVIEVQDEKIPDGAGTALCKQVLEKEGTRILSKLPENAYVITLEIEGTSVSSEELAALTNQNTLHGNSHLVFVIGGSLGLSDEVKGRAQTALSFSKLTYPHQMMRVILLEQVYRGFKIIHHEPYHK